MTFLLLYIAIFSPYKIAFIENEPRTIKIIDYIIDGLFLCDVIVNFFTPYSNNKEKLITNRKEIAPKYLRTWFFLDIVVWYIEYTQLNLSSLPFEFIFQENYNPNTHVLLRLTRLPKVYRLLKVVKLLKLRKDLKKIPILEKLIFHLIMNAGFHIYFIFEFK